jgi:hypothetical protein
MEARPFDVEPPLERAPTPRPDEPLRPSCAAETRLHASMHRAMSSVRTASLRVSNNVPTVEEPFDPGL